jgi:hypothetical protein
MSKILYGVLVVLLFGLVGASHASAGNFTKQNVENVISVMRDLDSDKIPSTMAILEEFGTGNFASVLDDNGNLEIFDIMLNKARNSDSEYAHFQEVTKENGYKDAEEWASMGNTVMKAYMETLLPRPQLERLGAITPEKLLQFPEKNRPKIELLAKMGRQLLSVPQDDIDTFSPYVQQFTDALD